MEAIIFTVIGLIIAFAFWGSGKQKESIPKIQELRLAYEQALLGTDKRRALAAGRAYHTALRKDRVLTMYDEMAISNDLSTMSSSPPFTQPEP